MMTVLDLRFLSAIDRVESSPSSWLQSIRAAWRDFIGGLRGFDVAQCPWCKGQVHVMDDKTGRAVDVFMAHVSPECE